MKTHFLPGLHNGNLLLAPLAQEDAGMDAPHSPARISGGQSDAKTCSEFTGDLAARTEFERSLSFHAPTGSHVPFQQVDWGFRDLFLFQLALCLFVCCAIYHTVKIFSSLSAKTLPQSLWYLPKHIRASVFLASPSSLILMPQPCHPGHLSDFIPEHTCPPFFLLFLLLLPFTVTLFLVALFIHLLFSALCMVCSK